MTLLKFDHITFDPRILHGQATIRGMRMGVAQVLNMIANGMPFEEVIREYPFLEIEDIRQALRYAALLANEEIHPLTAASA